MLRASIDPYLNYAVAVSGSTLLGGNMHDAHRKLYGLASLYEHVGRAIYGKQGRSDLQPAQWSALRFFQRAGVKARTVSGLARYLGVTMGPASRTARALERRGLLISQINPDDARSNLFTLTNVGADQLGRDPQIRLVAALETLEAGEFEALARLVSKLSTQLEKN